MSGDLELDMCSRVQLRKSFSVFGFLFISWFFQFSRFFVPVFLCGFLRPDPPPLSLLPPDGVASAPLTLDGMLKFSSVCGRWRKRHSLGWSLVLLISALLPTENRHHGHPDWRDTVHLCVDGLMSVRSVLGSVP